MSDIHFSKVLKDGESLSDYLTSDALVAIKSSTNRTIELGCPSIRLEPRAIAVVCKDNGYVKNAIAKRLVAVIGSGQNKQSEQPPTPQKRGRKPSVPAETETAKQEEPLYGGGFFQTVVARDEPVSSVQLDPSDDEQQPDE